MFGIFTVCSVYNLNYVALTDPHEQESANEASDSDGSDDFTGQVKHQSCSKQNQQQVNVTADNGKRPLVVHCCIDG